MSVDIPHGKVYLVGAGPGDVDLITIKAIRCLRKATIVLYDSLINAELLGYAPPEAKCIFVGKRSGKHSLSQEEINQMLCDLAEAGETVVRLKGGDPFLFGRGGEEAMAVAECGVEFEIVPGITSALAAPAFAGIPVTHRDFSSSVHIFTGHKRGESEDVLDLDWENIAHLEGTLIFLMGSATLNIICEQLIKHGKPEDTPIALIHRATLPDQKNLFSTLGSVVEEASGADSQPPVVIVVGDCVNLHEHLEWLSKRPLYGKRVIITRPEDQAKELAQEIKQYGATPIVAPVIQIVPLEDNKPFHTILRRLDEFDWILFASINSIKVFMQELKECGKSVQDLSKINIGTIGIKTAEFLKEQWGITANFVPSEYVQEKLAEELPISSGERVIIPRAATSRDVLPIVLRQRGVEVDVIPIYETAPQRDGILKAHQLLKEKAADIITFTSSSTVRFLLDTIPPEERTTLFSSMKVASIGPITSNTLREYNLPIHIEAREYTTDSLIEEIIKYYGHDS